VTDLQLDTMRAVRESAARGEWFRARRNGERVTLASLWTRGLLDRRAWRGVEGDADAAHEYTIRGMRPKNAGTSTPQSVSRELARADLKGGATVRTNEGATGGRT
jgi:hypothetical protein